MAAWNGVLADKLDFVAFACHLLRCGVCPSFSAVCLLRPIVWLVKFCADLHITVAQDATPVT